MYQLCLNLRIVALDVWGCCLCILTNCLICTLTDHCYKDSGLLSMLARAYRGEKWPVFYGVPSVNHWAFAMQEFCQMLCSEICRVDTAVRSLQTRGWTLTYKQMIMINAIRATLCTVSCVVHKRASSKACSWHRTQLGTGQAGDAYLEEAAFRMEFERCTAFSRVGHRVEILAVGKACAEPEWGQSCRVRQWGRLWRLQPSMVDKLAWVWLYIGHWVP